MTDLTKQEITNREIAHKLQEALNSPYYNHIRIDVLEALVTYVYLGIPPGGFLTAVLSNDLAEAVARADSENIVSLKEIVSFIYNELPSDCWGTDDKVVSWLTSFRDLGFSPGGVY